MSYDGEMLELAKEMAELRGVVKCCDSIRVLLYAVAVDFKVNEGDTTIRNYFTACR